ncbi:MAG TPA: lysoplasmalogenase family protein, partial [Ilumatobacteraceae bacterium]|nr:lysoplasmalogenase family protein [Ilumatobacteraceae bacterium]
MFVASIVITAVLALGNWWSRLTDNNRAEEITKPLVTVGAIAIALTGGGQTKLVAVCVIALLFCLVGDVALLPRVNKFIVGLAAFLVGHLAFDVMFFVDGLRSARLGGLALVLVGIIGAIAAPTILRGAASHKLSRPVGM